MESTETKNTRANLAGLSRMPANIVANECLESTARRLLQEAVDEALNSEISKCSVQRKGVVLYDRQRSAGA